MHWKRIVLFSLLFFILAVSLFYYVHSNVQRPLRKDTVPAGAYVVPWMKPSPSIRELNTNPAYAAVDAPPWSIDMIMATALRLNITFRITTRNETRVIPSTVYLGHDKEFLYVGGKFQGMYRNPASNPDDDPTLTLPNCFSIYFDVDNDGKLSFPESGSELAVCLGKGAGWHVGKSWKYEDRLWWKSNNPFAENRYGWDFVADYYQPNPQPALSLGDDAVEYDNSTGTLIMLFSKYLSRPEISETDRLQMRIGECWVMGFILELYYATWYEGMQNFVDGWPRNTYPWLSDDSSWWPKLVIDLTNPPPTIPGQAPGQL